MSQLLFTGFNGFQQFGKLKVDADVDVSAGHDTEPHKVSLKVSSFQPLSDEDTLDNLLIAPCWRYTAFARGKRLWLRGLLSAVPGEEQQVDTPAVVSALAVSDNYCLALLANGSLYKIAPHKGASLEPIKLELPLPCAEVCQKRTIFGELKAVEEPRITHVACGSHITAAISTTNAVYNLPSIVHQFPRHLRVKQLICGFEHALMLSNNGDVYAWGNGVVS